MKAKIKQTGPDSVVVEPIVLRPNQQTRLIFKPQIVNNRQDEGKPVKGDLLWQRRKPSEQGEESEEKFCLADPRCLIVAGSIEQFQSDPMKDSFELFRRGHRSGCKSDGLCLRWFESNRAHNPRKPRNSRGFSHF
jgi:hypothetical protein